MVILLKSSPAAAAAAGSKDIMTTPLQDDCHKEEKNAAVYHLLGDHEEQNDAAGTPSSTTSTCGSGSGAAAGTSSSSSSRPTAPPRSSAPPLVVVGRVLGPAQGHRGTRHDHHDAGQKRIHHNDEERLDEEEDNRQYDRQTSTPAIDRGLSFFDHDDDDEQEKMESRQDDDYVYVRRTSIFRTSAASDTIDEARSLNIQLRPSSTNSSTIETFSNLEHHPQQEESTAFCTKKNSNGSSFADHHDKRRHEVVLQKLHGMSRTPSSLSSSSSSFWPSGSSSSSSCVCRQQKQSLNHVTSSGAPRTGKFSHDCFHQGDATTATRSLSLESISQKGSNTVAFDEMMHQKWYACTSSHHGDRQYDNCHGLPLVLLINNKKFEGNNSCTPAAHQERARIEIIAGDAPVRAIQPGTYEKQEHSMEQIVEMDNGPQCQACNFRKGQEQCSFVNVNFKGRSNNEAAHGDDDQCAQRVITRELVSHHVVEGYNQSIKHVATDTSTSPRNDMGTGTTKIDAFGRLAEHTTKSYSLRQRAANAIRERNNATTSRRLCRDPSPLHERLARQETYSSARKKSHKSQYRTSSGCPFYTYVNPNSTIPNRMTPSNSYDTSPGHLPRTKMRSPDHVLSDGLLSRRPSMDPPPHHHGLPLLTRSATLDDTTLLGQKTKPFTLAPEWFPKDRLMKTTSNRQHHQEYLKVRHPSPTVRPFRTLMTAGSFKGDDISEITDSVMRCTPKNQIVNDVAVVNAPGVPSSCDSLSSSSCDRTAGGVVAVISQNQTTKKSATAVPASMLPRAPPVPAMPRAVAKNKHGENFISNRTTTMGTKEQQDDFLYYYNAEKIEQKKKELKAKQNDLYHRLANQDTVSSSRMKSKPLGEKILSSYEQRMIAEAKAKNYARRQRSTSVQPDEVFERLTTRGMEAALKNQLMVAKLIQEQKEWMQNR